MKLVTSLGRTVTGPVLLTPVVDGLLIIVVFFLFGSHLTSSTGIPVNLPKSSLQFVPRGESHLLLASAESLNPQPSSSKSPSSKEGATGRTSVLLLDGKRVLLSELAAKLRDLKDNSERKSVILQADQLCTHGLVVELTNAVLASGFELIVATSPAP